MKHAVRLLAFMTLLLSVTTTWAAVAFRSASSASSSAGASVTYVSTGSASSAAQGNITLNLPASYAVNDLLLCVVESHDTVASTVSTSGWTRLYSRQQGTVHTASLFYKFAASTSETNPVVTHASGDSIIGRCSAFRGVSTSSPFDGGTGAFATASSNSTTVTTGTLTVSSTNDKVLFIGQINNNPGSYSISTTGGLTWTQAFFSTTNSGSDSGIALHYATPSATGSLGPLAATISTSGSGISTGTLLTLKAGGSNSLTVSVPSGTTSGDVMVASVAVTTSGVTVTAPSGWTQILSTTQSTTTTSKLTSYYRVATSSEPSSYTWTFSGSTAHTGAVGGITSYSGADTNTPIDASSGQATSSGTSHAAPTLTPTTTGDMLVTVHEYASAGTWTPPTGMTEAVDVASTTTPSTSGISMEMNYLSLATSAATGTKTATASSGSGMADTGAAHSIAVKAPSSGMTCYTDTFSSITNWSVGSVSGSFGSPVVSSGRLRLTNATTGVSTYATLQRLFPASGNKIVVEFNHYAYNGSGGADGIGVILSDASIAPVAGAFGGSMGYAQKQVSAGGDTTHEGFAGGWLGIALDEFGNFSANTEGRTGGSAPGVTADAVALRGSGSGYNGYYYLAGTSTLSPGIDSVSSTSAAPGYRYRITVDHSNGVNAYTTVERDTTGTGSSYTTLISSFDAKAATGQAAVPTNWFLSFTGSTGASTNIHEVANLQVCSNTQKTISLDHVRITHDGSALTCGPEPITITACADATCSTLYLGSVTVNLSTTGGTWSSNPVTFTGGSTQVTLSKSTAGSVTIGGSVTSPSTMTAICYDGSTERACSGYPLTYTVTTACFDAVEVNANPGTNIYTKLAGTAFSLDVVRASGSTVITNYTGTVTVDLVDPSASSGNCSDTNTGLTTSSNYTYTTSDAGRKTFNFTYPYAAKNIRVRMRDASSGVVCSTDDFSVRPYALSVLSSPTSASADTANGSSVSATPIFKAGSGTFTVSTTAVNAAGSAVGLYTGTPKVDIALLEGTSILGTLATSPTVTTPPTFQTAASSTCATCTPVGTFIYDEVGYVHFKTLSLYDDTWAGNDIAKGDCTSDFSNSKNSSGKYGCYFGNSSDLSASNHFWAGRFIPDHFAITAGTTTAACTTHTGNDSTDFTYYGQDSMRTAFVITAQTYDNSTTVNYTGSYAKLGLTTYANYNFTAATLKTGSALSSSSTAPTGTWGAGTASVRARHQISRPTSVTTDGGPNSVVISAKPTDSDGVTVATATAVSSATEFRYGRLHLANAFGSELLDLSMFGQTEYYNGGWVLNEADSCTALSSPTWTETITDTSCTASSLGTSPSSSNTTPWTVSAGSLGMKMTKPSSQCAGYADVTFGSTPSHLLITSPTQMINNTSARATFGIPKTNSRVIYRRESF